MSDKVSTVAVSQDAPASEEEIRKARELLRANGYGLVAYRDAGEKIKRTVGSGVGFVRGKCRPLVDGSRRSATS